MEFDPAEFVRASGAAQLLKVSPPRVYQLVNAGELVPIATPVGRLFRVTDCLTLRRARSRRKALAVARRGKP